MILKPDERIKGEMVLMNWMRHRQGRSDEQIQDILGYASRSSVSVLRLFKHSYQTDRTKWDPIPMSPDCFLWNWQSEARDFLKISTRTKNLADKTEIDQIIKAIYEPRGSISQREATEWADEINGLRRK